MNDNDDFFAQHPEFMDELYDNPSPDKPASQQAKARASSVPSVARPTAVQGELLPQKMPAFFNESTHTLQTIGGNRDTLRQLDRAHRGGLWGRRKSQEIEQVLINGDVQRAREEVEYLLSITRSARNSQLQEITEQLNARLVAGKAKFRDQLNYWFLEQYNRFQQRMQTVQEDFERHLDYVQHQIDTCRHPRMRPYLEKNMEDKIARFFELQDKLTRDFENSIREGINKFSGSAVVPTAD